MIRTLLPRVLETWIDEDSMKIGYAIPFTRYFYKPLSTLEEIRADSLSLEAETEGLLHEIMLGEEMR